MNHKKILPIFLGLLAFASNINAKVYTHNESFYITVKDHHGNQMDAQDVTYGIAGEATTNYSIPSDQRKDAKDPGCFTYNESGNAQNPIHCFWEVGRKGNTDAASFFNKKVGNNYSAVMSGGRDADFHPGKPSSKLNFAWSSVLEFNVYDDQFCSMVPTSKWSETQVPVKQYYLNYTLGQSGENLTQIALNLGKSIVVNKIHDALCEAAFEEGAVKDWSCGLWAVSDWVNTVDSFITAWDNPWILGLQTLSGNETSNIPPSLSAGYLTDYTTDGSTLKTALVARLVSRDSGKEMPLYRANDPDGDFLVYATTNEQDMTAIDLILSRKLTKYLYTGQPMNCESLNEHLDSFH